MTGERTETALLIGPVKIGGVWRRPGERVPVSPAQLADLRAAGAVGNDAAAGPAVLPQDATISLTLAEFEERLAVAAQALAEAMLGTAVEEAVRPLQDEIAVVTARAEAAEAQTAALEARLAATQIPADAAEEALAGAEPDTHAENTRPEEAPTGDLAPPASKPEPARKRPPGKKG